LSGGLYNYGSIVTIFGLILCPYDKRILPYVFFVVWYSPLLVLIVSSIFSFFQTVLDLNGVPHMNVDFLRSPKLSTLLKLHLHWLLLFIYFLIWSSLPLSVDSCLPKFTRPSSIMCFILFFTHGIGIIFEILNDLIRIDSISI